MIISKRSKRALSLLFIVTLLLSACQPLVAPVEIAPAAEDGLNPELEAKIDTYAEEMMATIGLPGLALGVVKDGELAYAKGFGVADAERGDPVTPQTVFQLAEVTMAPTTLAMLQLADAGLLDLDAPITDYLPYFEMTGDGWEEITARHLLLQTSGVPDSGDTAADWTEMTPELDDEAVERLVRGLAETEMLYAPGEGFEWSDIGFHILGDVVAKVTGQPYEVYMQENFFTPLGMTHSTFLRDEVDPALLASPHIQDESGAAIVTDAIPYSRQYASANNLHTNLEDMARFAQANLNRGELDGATILAAPHFDEMWMVQNETNLGEFQMGSLYPTALFADQGMGWSVAEIAGHPVVHAYGGERGYQSDFMLAPEDNVAVIVMGNRAAGEDFYPLDAVADVMGMVLDDLGGSVAMELDPAEATTLDPTTIAEVETMIAQTMEEAAIPGFVIGVVKDGQVAYTQEFGYAEDGAERLMTAETLFPVASMSKQFTAVAIMQLVDQGEIDLDAPVTDYLPYFEMADPRYSDITIRQLMAHTSGMPSLPQREYGYDSTDPGEGVREEHVRSLAKSQLGSDPGETWSYSNFGYNMLGEVVANVSGEPYEEYVQRHILDPLGMESSTLLFNEIDFEALARGHYLDAFGNMEKTEIFPYTRAYAPSTGLVTNLADLNRWALALSNHGETDGEHILAEAAFDEMWSTAITLGWGGLLQDYGLGWFMAEEDGHKLAWHVGTNPGYLANIIIAPDEGIAVVTLDNLLPLTGDPPWHASDVGNAVMLMLLDADG